MIRARFFSTLLLSLAIAGCTADALRAPSLDDNRLYAVCTSQLLSTYTAMESEKDAIPAGIRQKVVSLLIAAEIDGQFKRYPICVDKLARARLFLKQAKLDISEPIFPHSENKPGPP